jgi:hypothetical protein
MAKVLQLSSSQNGTGDEVARYKVVYPQTPPGSPSKRSAASIEAVKRAYRAQPASQPIRKRKRESSPSESEPRPAPSFAFGLDLYRMSAAPVDRCEDIVTSHFAKASAVERIGTVSWEQRQGRR